MNKIKTTIAGVFGAVLIAAGVTTVVLINQKPQSEPAKTQTAQSTQLSVKDNQLSFTAEKGKNVLDQLKSKTKVVTQDSAYGPYVTAIGGISQGEGKYWSFYVNGTLAQKGAADYITNGGEHITWKLE